MKSRKPRSEKDLVKACVPLLSVFHSSRAGRGDNQSTSQPAGDDEERGSGVKEEIGKGGDHSFRFLVLRYQDCFPFR